MKKLIVYTSRTCPRCAALKKWLRKNKVSFKEKNIDDTDVMTELVMRNLVVLSAPALELKNRVYLSNRIFLENGSLDPKIIKILEGGKN